MILGRIDLERLARSFYCEIGNLTHDGEDYEYVYDAFGRLRFVKDTSDQSVVAEYTYNGLGYRIGWHYDVDADGTVEANLEHNADDPWFHFVYDTRWRIVAVYRVLHWKDGGGWAFDADPKERFVYHNAGLAGGADQGECIPGAMSRPGGQRHAERERRAPPRHPTA